MQEKLQKAKEKAVSLFNTAFKKLKDSGLKDKLKNAASQATACVEKAGLTDKLKKAKQSACDLLNKDKVKKDDNPPKTDDHSPKE